MYKTSVNLVPCCIKQTAKSLWARYRFNKCRSTISLGKITNYMLWGHALQETRQKKNAQGARGG